MIQIISNIFFTTRRNPFGAGTVFQFNNPRQFIFDYGSQSLWSRDGFSILSQMLLRSASNVAIPLEQGRFFNKYM